MIDTNLAAALLEQVEDKIRSGHWIVIQLDQEHDRNIMLAEDYYTLIVKVTPSKDHPR